MIWGKIMEGDHIIKGKIKSRVPMIWGKSIERDHIIKGKTKYCGGVKIRDKKNVGYVENGRVRVSSSEPVTQNCLSRESNPGYMLGRQLFSPLYHRRL
jgi:hypothetical protein